jgi:DNA polymerase I
MTKRPLYILDSYAFIYRSYFAFLSRPLKSPSGANVSAAFGFFRFLFNLFESRNPGAFAAVFDPKGKTFRHEMYAEYKATRQKTPEDLHAQVPLVEDILRALGLPVLRTDGYEADDLIAALATRARAEGRECWIVSGDKDLLQLVGGSVKALRPDASFAYRPYGPEEVAAEWGVAPDRILDYLSLTGDASDNVPGVPGVGDKTALKLLAEFKSLAELYDRLGEVKPEGLRKKLEAGRDSAFLSYKLITLDADAPTGIADLDELDVEGLDRAKANALFIREGMKSLVSSGDASLFAAGSAAGGAAGPSAEAPARAAPPDTPAHLLGPGEYETVTGESALAAWVDRCIAAGVFAFDCETDSLDELAAEVVGFSLSCEPRKACYVPLRCPEDEHLGEDAARKQLARLFSAKRGADSVVLVGHNVKYDWHVMRRFGAPMRCVLRDTMIAAWLLDAEAPSLALGALAERRLGNAGIAFEEVVPKGASFAMVPAAKATAYAAEDADFTLRLHLLMEAELEAAGQTELYRDLEMPTLPILGSMEAAGILVDSGELRAYGVELEEELDSIQRDIWKDVGHDFNIASPKQLQEVLFVERKLQPGKKTKTGFSTDSSVLEELAALDVVPRKILRHRSLAKLKSTYVDSLATLAEEDAAASSSGGGPELFGKTGRVHTHYMQTGAATGRLSSRDPNLQNIPVRDEEGRRIRKAFTAEEGNLLVSADYSQIELVVLAHLSQDPGLLKAFREGVDVHRRTASLLFGLGEEEVTPDKRRIAKTINFGVIYGMSAFRLSNELGIPRGEAQKFIDAYFETYSGVRDFIDKVVREAEERGYSTTILGRRRPIAAINSRNKTEKQAAERVAVNTPIQGSAADVVKLAMLRVASALEAFDASPTRAGRTRKAAGEGRGGPAARLLLQVHDELIAEAPEKEAEAVAALMKREMEGAIELSLPLRVSVETGRRWGEMH